VLDLSQDSQEVDSDSLLQLTVNATALLIQWISRILSQFKCPVRLKWTRNIEFESNMEVQALLKIRIPCVDVGTTIPHGQYMMSSVCRFDRCWQREIYGTAEFDLVAHQTGAPVFHRILDCPNDATVQLTRHLLIIDLISHSLHYSNDTKSNPTLTNIPGLLPSASFSIPFAYFASVGEILLVEWLQRHTLSTLP